MRKLLSEILTSTGEIEVVGLARDGEEAISLAARLKPEVITLDVQMPGRSGVEILPDLLTAHEVPVVMVSALTREGADVTLAALEQGAVDYMPKPEKFQLTEMRQSGPQLVAKVLTAAQSRVRRNRRIPRGRIEPVSHDQKKEVPLQGLQGPRDIVAVIGISTGGPQTLAGILPLLEFPVPPILIVQHMPARFTEVFAERLNRSCPLLVKQAATGDPVLPGQILIAPGGRHVSVVGKPPKVVAELSDADPVSGHRPSIDVLFRTAAHVYGAGSIGFLMTGMGRDGVDGCQAIIASGGMTYAQDEATSIVYGMNKAAWLEGAARAQFQPEELPTILRLHARRGGKTNPES
jgi:two-component system chemotaxis response regulator CheB